METLFEEGLIKGVINFAPKEGEIFYIFIQKYTFLYAV